MIASGGVDVCCHILMFVTYKLTTEFGGPDRGASKLLILINESVDNPERPYVTLVHSCQRRFHFYIVVELLATYINWVVYL